MSIDKWLSKKDSKEEQRREKAFQSLSEDEVKDLKKKKSIVLVILIHQI